MMTRTARLTNRIIAAAGAVLVLSGASCHDEERTDPDPERLPAELLDPARPPPADVLLPPLPAFRVDDGIDAGEIRASLDDGDIPYLEVRRRLLRDAEGFTLGDIMVVTFQPEADGVERFLRHWFGDAARDPVDVGGVDLLRVAAEPHDALAWAGPHFVVVFGRGREATQAWLEEVARTTVAGITQADANASDRPH